jgi:hypothetical protein
MFVRCVAQITLLSVYSSWRKMSYCSLCHFWSLLKAAGVVCSARNGWSMIQTGTSLSIDTDVYWHSLGRGERDVQPVVTGNLSMVQVESARDQLAPCHASGRNRHT